jgi:hypothetical protein
MTDLIKMLFRIVVKGRWKVVRTGWPLREGYGTYHPRKRTLLDSGLSLEQAKHECALLNRGIY